MQLLLAHSCPSCAESVLDELGIHLVAFDRPGYGQSSPQRRRNFTTFVRDLEQLADHLRCPPGCSSSSRTCLAAALQCLPSLDLR